MRKFLLLLTTVFIIILSPASAQTPGPGEQEKRKVSLGIKTGVNVSKLKLNGKIPGLMTTEFRTGFLHDLFLYLGTTLV